MTTIPTIDPERLQKLDSINLLEGEHESRDEGMCALEAVAWLAREDHTDHPECVSPLIADLVRNWNDALPADEDRNRLLRPLLTDMIGTAQDAALELARLKRLLTWYTGVFTPAWLDRAGLPQTAAALREEQSDERIFAARDKANAAWAAARAAARAAAWDAARDAARAAAWDAARAAAWDAARAAAGDAAGDAARVAAHQSLTAFFASASADGSNASPEAMRATAAAALAPTVATLQASLVELIRELCAMGRGNDAPAKAVARVA